MNKQPHLPLFRQQDSLQKIDQMQVQVGTPAGQQEFSAERVVVAEALSELVKVIEVSGTQSIQGVYRTLSLTSKDTLGFNFKLAARDISQYVL